MEWFIEKRRLAKVPWRHIQNVEWFEDSKEKTFNITVKFDGNGECRKWLLQWVPILASVCASLLKQEKKEGEKVEREEG